jgi:hypothetical protein
MWQSYSYQLQTAAANTEDIQSKFGSAYMLKLRYQQFYGG